MKEERMNNYADYEDPAPKILWFRDKHWKAGKEFSIKKLKCGKLMYSMEGLVEVKAKSSFYLSTSEYAIWLPPCTPHESFVKTDTHYIIIHIAINLCKTLPNSVKTLKLNGIVKEIIIDFCNRNIRYPHTESDIILSKALIQQLQLSKEFSWYLPLGDQDELIEKMISYMCEENYQFITLYNWSEKLGLSERTLSRRFSKSTGISFNEWKIRKKILSAIKLLKKGKSVKYIASTLNYSNSSAFIAMFKNRTGSSPSDFL